MSDRTPDLRQMTAARLVAAVPTATVIQNLVDPAKATRILAQGKTTLITVAFGRIARENISHAALFRALGELDVVVYALSPLVLDSTLVAVHEALLTDAAWLSTFESVDSLATDYEYVDGGDVDVSAARVRVACQWSEDYQPVFPDLDSVHIRFRIAQIVGGESILAEIDDETEILLDEPVLDFSVRTAMVTGDPIDVVI
jgi:hypothetical protein